MANISSLICEIEKIKTEISEQLSTTNEAPVFCDSHNENTYEMSLDNHDTQRIDDQMSHSICPDAETPRMFSSHPLPLILSEMEIPVRNETELNTSPLTPINRNYHYLS